MMLQDLAPNLQLQKQETVNDDGDVDEAEIDELEDQAIAKE